MMRRYAPTQWNRPKVGALFVLTAFTLAACATPQPAVPATDLTQWWERFHDPILSRLIDDALVANPTLAGAAASLQQARALRDVAEAGLWPQGQGTGSARRSTQGTAASNRADSTLVSLGIEESWTLDVFGGKRSALAAQQAAVWSRMANLGDYRVQISAELATTYINLRAAQARLALAQQTLSSQSHTRQLVGWRRQAGLVSALDSDQADFAFASTQASLPALQNAITQSSHALSVLTGRPPLELVGLLEEVRAVPVVETSLVLNLPAETLRRRADVRAGEFAVLEALGRLGQAEAATKPSFTLGGSIGLSAAGLGTLLNGSSLLTALSASVLVPIGPGPAAQVRADQAGVELAKHAYRVKQFSCQVIGITKPKGQIGMGDQDNSIVTPLKTFLRRVSGNSQIGLIVINMTEGADSASLKSSLTQLMRERRKLGDLKTGGADDNFNIFDTQQLADTLSGTMGLLTSLLGAVAAVSLLVGGIGIMNIMLVSVTERTREIGLRLAVGALEGEVLLQFLIEAVVLSALGGLIGILLATAASIGLSSLLNLPYRFDPAINIFALFFSGLIGVIFGYFPARGAARMDPIEALRHE